MPKPMEKIKLLSTFEKRLASLDPSLDKPQIRPSKEDLSSLDGIPPPSKDDIDLEDGVEITEDPYDDSDPDSEIIKDSDFFPGDEDTKDDVKSKVLSFQLLTLHSQVPTGTPTQEDDSADFFSLVDSVVEDGEDLPEETDDQVDLKGIFPDGFDEEDDADEDPPEEEIAFFDFISSYFAVCPSPSDEQIHALAASIGIDHEELERRIYKLMSLMLENDEISEEARDTLNKLLPN